MFKVSSKDAQAARAWFDTPAALAWREQEAALLADILPRLIGYRGFQIGAPLITSEIAKCMGTLRLWQADMVNGPHVDVRIDGRSLPLMSGSVDVLIVAHGLELSSDPQALIRECTRVLSARGQMACLVFNPLSFWAGTQRLRRSRNRFVSRAMPPRAARLIDWLRLLDFETTGYWCYGPGFPLFGRHRQAREDKEGLSPLAWTAPGYAIVARRRALLGTPLSKRRLLARQRKHGLAPVTGISSHS